MRSTSFPIFRASIKSVSPRRSRRLEFFLSRARNQRQTGICVVKNNWPGSATMQSTRSASIKALRISPSFEVCVDMEPFARTNPATPTGAGGWRRLEERRGGGGGGGRRAEVTGVELCSLPIYQALANLAFVRCLGGHEPVREEDSRHAHGREVMD